MPKVSELQSTPALAPGDLVYVVADGVSSKLASLRVANIAAMTAIAAPANGMSVEVTEDGRGGLFVFDTSVTAAGNGGTTFSADDATAGSWVRRTYPNLDYRKGVWRQIENYQYETPYDVSSLFAAATAVSTFESAEFRIIEESGALIVRLEFTGFINQVRLQLRNGSGSFLNNHFYQLSGESAAPTNIKTLFDGDAVTKVAYAVFTDVPTNTGNYRGAYLSLNHNVADQDATFSVVSVKYGWLNSRSVTKKRSWLPLPRNMLAIRGYWEGSPLDVTHVFWDTDAGVEGYKAEILDHRERLPLEGVRFPAYVKAVTNSNGTVIATRIARLVQFLDWLHSYNLSAIVEVNHFFSTGNEAETIQDTDIDTGPEITSMAARVGALAAAIGWHPAVRLFEIENEINLAYALPFADRLAYLQAAHDAIKANSNKLTSVSLSGALAHNYWLNALQDVVDVIDIHTYGSGLTQPVELSIPLISTECGTAGELIRQQQKTGIVCPWHSYVKPGSSSYVAAVVTQYNQPRPPDDTDILPWSGFQTHSANFYAAALAIDGRAVVAATNTDDAVTMGGAVDDALRGSATWDAGSIANGAGETTTVSVAGAALGDFAQASFSLDLQGLTISAWVSAAGTVSVRLFNSTGGAVNLNSGTVRAKVSKQF